MTETVINYNNKKRAKILLLGVGLALFSLLFIIDILFLSDVIKIYYLLFFSLIFFGSIYFIITGIRSMLSKDKTGLVLNETGILSKVTPNGKRLGLIAWKDISALAPTKAYGVEFVSLVTNHPEKYVTLLTDQISKKQLTEQNIILNIASSELDISYEDLKNLIEKYFTTYRATAS
jgi:hypothetical protein